MMIFVIALEFGLLINMAVQGSALDRESWHLKFLLGRTSPQEFKKLHLVNYKFTARLRSLSVPRAFDPKAFDAFLLAGGSSAEVQEAKQRVLRARRRYLRSFQGIGLGLVAMIVGSFFEIAMR